MSQVINTRSKREALLKSRQEELEFGWELQLPDASETTGEDFYVRIRKLSLAEKSAYTGVPDDMAELVMRRTKDFSKMAQEKSKGKQQLSEFEFLDMLKDPDFEDVINTVCLAAFIDPPLVASEEELKDKPDAWLLDDFSFGDRLHVFTTLQKPNSKEAQTMRRFRPESATDVGRGGTVEQAEGTA